MTSHNSQMVTSHCLPKICMRSVQGNLTFSSIMRSDHQPFYSTMMSMPCNHNTDTNQKGFPHTASPKYARRVSEATCFQFRYVFGLSNIVQYSEVDTMPSTATMTPPLAQFTKEKCLTLPPHDMHEESPRQTRIQFHYALWLSTIVWYNDVDVMPSTAIMTLPLAQFTKD